MLLNAFWGALRASEKVLVDVSGVFKVACSIHVFVSVRRRARGVPINIQTHVFEISRRLWQNAGLAEVDGQDVFLLRNQCASLFELLLRQVIGNLSTRRAKLGRRILRKCGAHQEGENQK